jgi:uncharacterized repeat protein (TIGR01451 family)
MVNSNFSVTIDNWQPFTATQEVGSVARYKLSVRNTGQITAYEVVLSNLLPDGVSYQGNPFVNSNPPASLQFLQLPTMGSVGTIQFPSSTSCRLTPQPTSRSMPWSRIQPDRVIGCSIDSAYRSTAASRAVSMTATATMAISLASTIASMVESQLPFQLLRFILIP